MESLSKRARIGVVLVIGFILALSGYFFYMMWNSSGRPQPTGAQTATADSHVSFEIKGGDENQKLVVTWKDIGSGEQALNIYKSQAGTGNWSLWRSVPIPKGSQATGVAEVGAGHDSLNGSSFYAQGVSYGGGGGGGSGDQNIIWTSPPTTPSSTDGTGGQNQNPPEPPGGTSTTAPSGPLIPSFQVSNSDTWIEITWQNLPTSTTSLVISRAGTPGGPWTTFFTEPNPVLDGPYTIKVVIDTPNTPLYYELTAYNGSALVGIYGPVYLSAIHQ
ncbi:MAG: hypothetical protein A3B25_01615 [Candidatus Ryanbacteria bacterium RIFCSPLOWO2_01_FULL_48_26]|uniref:Uncharacterized protein n=1 Tax=Candidatus Ryanbacteria bacterium RIFCSPLOWO2_01_FULL_48_26 TaxID=1802126 RepID=A0A1G2GWZ9_9BACT|nr:MAG: hypothetical protein A3B25_01615 [Candidatus Ryanbacteria bacterium RIFCSPLOWO2_01_FULL_48_26]